MDGFMEPVGTSFQSAMADLKDVAIKTAARIEKPHPLKKFTTHCRMCLIFM